MVLLCILHYFFGAGVWLAALGLFFLISLGVGISDMLHRKNDPPSMAGLSPVQAVGPINLNVIKEQLAYLASDRIQQKYIVNTTKDEYILPDEILDSLIHNLRQYLGSSDLNVKARREETEILRNFYSQLNRYLEVADPDNQNISNDEMVNKDENWIHLRNSAKKCLESLRFNLTDWENKHLQN